MRWCTERGSLAGRACAGSAMLCGRCGKFGALLHTVSLVVVGFVVRIMDQSQDRPRCWTTDDDDHTHFFLGC